MSPDDLPVWLSERIEVADDGCWTWTAARAGGYGRVYDRRTGRPAGAHRVVLEVATGQPIPPGLVVDHLCGIGLCVNPDHLEPVTNIENLKRGWAAVGTRPSVTQQAKDAPPKNRTRIIVKPTFTDGDPDDLIQVNVRIPRHLLNAVDAARAITGTGRDKWVIEALTQVLPNEAE